MTIIWNLLQNQCKHFLVGHFSLRQKSRELLVNMHASLWMNITLIESIQQTRKGTVHKQQRHNIKKEIMLRSWSLLGYTYWNLFVGTSQSMTDEPSMHYSAVFLFFSPRIRPHWLHVYYISTQSLRLMAAALLQLRNLHEQALGGLSMTLWLQGNLDADKHTQL